MLLNVAGNRKGKYTKRLEKEKQSERELKASKLKQRAALEQTRLDDAAAKSPTPPLPTHGAILPCFPAVLHFNRCLLLTSLHSIRFATLSLHSMHFFVIATELYVQLVS